jgi:hypothetical protein
MDGACATKPGPEFWKPLFDWWLEAKPLVPLVDQHLAALEAATTEDALKAAFTKAYNDRHRMTDAENAAVLAKKDGRKAAITVPGSSPPATAPAEPTATAHPGGGVSSGELLLDDLRAQLTELLSSRGWNYTQLCVTHGKRVLGWDGNKQANPPKLETLTVDQVRHFVDLMKPPPAGR